MAPHARLAIYKALWAVDATGGGSGTDADIVAAIDAAVSDGVDVINYSISGSGSTYVNADRSRVPAGGQGGRVRRDQRRQHRSGRGDRRQDVPLGHDGCQRHP